MDKIKHCSPGKNKYKAVHVVWHDASDVMQGWCPIEVVKDLGREAAMIHTIGLLLEDRKAYILVAMSIDRGICDMVLKIPRENIRRIRVLEHVVA